MDTALEDLTWPAHTDRLLLRPLAHRDVAAVFEYRRLPEVMEWVGSAPTDLDAFTRRVLDPSSGTNRLVVELDGTIVGDLMLDFQDAWAQREVADQATRTQGLLGWTFDPDHHGHGYATEAVAESLHRDHGWVDGLGYALLATEWRTRCLRWPGRPRTR